MSVFPFSSELEEPQRQEFAPALTARERENFVRLLYLVQYPEAGAALIYAISIAGAIGWQAPLTWLAMMYVMQSMRFLVINRALADIDSVQQRVASVVWANTAVGFCWGVSIFYFAPVGMNTELAISMIWLVGLLVSAMGLVAVSSNHPMLWGSPVMFFLLTRLFLTGEQTFVFMGFGVILLVGFFGVVVYFTREIIRRDFYRERQNASLVEQLSTANTYAKELNEELRMEISRRKEIESELRYERDQAERLSTIDSLTGISNRRAFDEALTDEVARARRHEHALSLIFIDVDRFKNFNDARGHQAGDDVLRQVAKIIEQSTRRGTDKSCRYGGEEFAVLLPNTDLTHAARIAEEIRNQLLAEKIAHPESDIGPYITVSLGVSTITPFDSGAGEKLVHTADQALYAAKAGGRNQTQTIDPQ
ncbi:MAG: diguanylate cyclase [Pseudomonadota bacterium]